MAAFDDDARDATGPGSYRKPGDSEIVDGDFDLRRFEVWVEGDEVVFKVTIAAPFRQPAVTARSGATPLPLWNQIYLQNIDIYIDTDRGAKGETACVPGRRVAFPDGRSWKVAVVLTPQPGAASGVTRDALGEAGKRVLFPKNLTASGRTITARVPAAALGGRPAASWGYSVHVSGARWERTFSVVDRLTSGKPEPDAFTMPVLGVVEAWAFGGAPEGSAHPRVVDVLLPRGADQKAILGSFDAASGAYARVPFVELAPSAPPPAAPPTTPPPPLSIVDVSGTTATIGGDVTGIQPMMIGQVLGRDGATVAKVVVVRVLPAGLVVDVVDGTAARGATVRFERNKPQP